MTYNSDGSLASVQALHDQTATVNGDTITIPAGTFTWTGGPVHNNNALQITKAITLQGAGSGSTIVKDGGTGGRFMLWTLVSGQLSRITGIHWEDGGRASTVFAPTGVVHVDGRNTDGSQFRFDHCIYDQLKGLFVPDTVIGVFDHNTWNGYADTIFYVYGSRWNDHGPYGDGSWAAPVVFGSSQFLFFENETFNNVGNESNWITFDAVQGGRFCIRKCTFNDARISDHGTESDGRGRGNRAIEVYQNTFAGTRSAGAPPGGTRSARTIFWGNTVAPAYSFRWILNDYRTDAQFPVGFNNLDFGGASGINRWDVNDPVTYYTATSTTAVGAPVADAAATWTAPGNPGWTPNQWVNYTLVNRTVTAPPHVCLPNGGYTQTPFNFGRIRSNTANTITWNAGDYEHGMAIAIGDSMEIHKVIQTIDQPGVGQGSLVDPTDCQASPPAGWNNQVIEPHYEWGNTPDCPIQSGYPYIVSGVHYFNNTPLPGYTPYQYPHPLTQTEMITLAGTTATTETITLTWTGALGTTVDIYRDGTEFQAAAPNSGTYTTTETGSGIGVSHVWEVRGSTASNDVTLV